MFFPCHCDEVIIFTTHVFFLIQGKDLPPEVASRLAALKEKEKQLGS